MADPTPGTPSSAYTRMTESWRTISDILAGPTAIRAARERYLPIYEAERGASSGYRGAQYTGEYDRRLRQAPWRPEFVDILQALSSKPFGKEVALTDDASEAIRTFAEDVDARGNNLTAFAKQVFKGGIAKGCHGILVDFPAMQGVRTLAEERAAGARPYWVSIRAEDILALYTEFSGGKEVVTHLRLREVSIERDGFGEKTVERVRVLEPKIWQLWRKKETDARSNVDEWELEDEGEMSLGVVPLALFWTGEREGPQFVRPPLEAIADMQIELYRALSRQEEILTYAGSPMLSAEGIAPPEGGEKLEVGPKRVLFAPAGPEGTRTGWKYIQPDAANLTEIRESVQTVIDDIRRLGMQPLTQKSGTITATATSVEAAKAHTVVEAWALGLKDVLEQALVFTSLWLKETESAASVEVDTDFSVDPYAQAPLDALGKARERHDISQRTYWQGLRRFDVLPPDFDPEVEEKRLIDEMPGEAGEDDEAAALGLGQNRPEPKPQPNEREG